MVLYRIYEELADCIINMFTSADSNCGWFDSCHHLPELPQLGEVGGCSGAAVGQGERVVAQLHRRQQLLLRQSHVHLVLEAAL